MYRILSLIAVSLLMFSSCSNSYEHNIKDSKFILPKYRLNYNFDQINSSYNDFKNYLKEYNKDYLDVAEFNYRFNVFKTNVKYINEVNFNSSKTYKLGLNNFTDISHNEFKEKYLTKNNVNNRQHNLEGTNTEFFYKFINGKNRPESIDWRAAGIVTDVKDQGQCGSCWAFSAVGTMEGQHALASHNLVSLSEQNLVDCSSVNDGCGGGWPDKAMIYVENNGGIDTEASYPYNDSVIESCEYNKNNSGAKFSNVVDLPSKNMSALYNAIGLIGPISVAIDAEYDFQLYKSGIFESYSCSPDNLDHAVLAVGYGGYNGTSFIIIKNSWNTNWGMDGYIYFSTMIFNMCGISTAASYPIV